MRESTTAAEVSTCRSLERTSANERREKSGNGCPPTNGWRAAIGAVVLNWRRKRIQEMGGWCWWRRSGPLTLWIQDVSRLDVLLKNRSHLMGWFGLWNEKGSWGHCNGGWFLVGWTTRWRLFCLGSIYIYIYHLFGSVKNKLEGFKLKNWRLLINPDGVIWLERIWRFRCYSNLRAKLLLTSTLNNYRASTINNPKE